MLRLTERNRHSLFKLFLILKKYNFRGPTKYILKWQLKSLSWLSSFSEESNGEDSDDHHNGGLDVRAEGGFSGGSLGGAGGLSDVGSVAGDP